MGQACWVFYIFCFFGSSQCPLRWRSFAPFYRRGEHRKYKPNDLPTIMQPWHCFFLFWGPSFSNPKAHVLFLWHRFGETRDGDSTRVRKPFSHLGYSRHCDECLDYITTGNSPTKLMKKVLLFPFSDSVLWKNRRQLLFLWRRKTSNTLMFKIPKSAPTVQMASSEVAPSLRRPLFLFAVNWRLCVLVL